MSERTETVKFARPVDRDLAADIEKQGVYVSPFVRRLKVTDDLAALTYAVDEDKADDVRPKMERFSVDMAARFRKLQKKIVAAHERASKTPLRTGVYEELKRRRWVLELGRGQVGLAGPALKALGALDADCARIGTEEFGAAPESYPTLIPASVLGSCGYFVSFPHAVSMVTHLVEDYDAIERFRQANAESKELVIPDGHAFPTPEACLVPAVCYHCYQGLAGQDVAEGRVFTSVGKCFRYESSNITGLDRLWDFTMREVIFVGTEKFVVERRQQGIQAVMDQVRRWDLDGVVETANDPFFATTYATKTYYQVRSDLKFELRLAVEPRDGEARTLACGSFNLHEGFFGQTFDIKTTEGKAFTGCVAWGLDRWVLACFTQHGFEPEGWPEHLRGPIFG